MQRPPTVKRCDGETFVDFLIAGTFFLRKYRAVVNDLNVFPVPDGDTGTNMLLTVRTAMVEARRNRSDKLSVVAAAAAHGSLMGARGNSGVIISQMFRGFAHAVRHRDSIETIDLAVALNEAVHAARQSLLKPVEGTILSVASAAASAAFKVGVNEQNFYVALHAIVSAANEALEKTPEQLAVLKEAKVVDAGGQGLVYFLEGSLRMLPGRAPYTTAFPRRPVRRATFTGRQKVEEHRFCTEFILATDTMPAHKLRTILADHGDSLIVAGGDGALRVHIHTDYPNKVMDLAREYGDVSKTKVDNMEDQHNILVVDRESKPRGIVCVVPGDGFAKICKELGADVTVLGGPTMNPSVKDLLKAVNNVLAPVVYLFTNDKNITAAAAQLQELSDRRIVVVPTRSVAEGIAALFGLINQPADEVQDPERLIADSTLMASGSIFCAGRDAALHGVAVKRGELMGALDARNGKSEQIVKGPTAHAVAAAMVGDAGAADASLITLYYGSVRKLKDADAVAEALRAAYPKTAVEVYYGGQQSSDYVISIER
ncbi:MAG TPA: DAK2 domain-containing protein [Candidatus Acidoferrales bacterium]|nr:DAK2 domain-containing protein [Candidatus Acidoferrales bacterium]